MMAAAPSPTVRATDHQVPTLAPRLVASEEPHTLLDLFSSWIGDDDDPGDASAAVKVAPRPVDGPSDMVVVPEGAERDAIVPIDPAPKIAITPPIVAPTLAGSRSAANGSSTAPVSPEPLGILTMRLVSTSLVAASLWGRSVSADEGQGDELDRFAAASARRLDRPHYPASRRLVERARPPLKAGRVITSKDGVDFLTPIEPAAAPAAP